MRRFLGIGAAAALAVFVLAQVSGTNQLDSYAKALNSSKSISATYTVQKPNMAAATYKIDFAKPNMARIDTPNQIVVADGKTITTYDKAENSFYKKPQTADDFKALFNSDDTGLYAAFFDSNYFSKVASVKPAGTKNRKGVTYNVIDVSMDKSGKKVVSFYLDPSDKIARVADINTVDGANKDNTIIMTKEFAMDGDNSKAMAFSAPDGAKEVSLADMSSGKWFTSWSEAMAMAKKANKPIFVDFYTDWCHWCKVLDAEVYPSAEFKAEAKNWILCKIDAEKGEGVDLAAKYQVSGYPTVKYVGPDGNLIGGFVGYMPTGQVVSNMKSGHQ